MSYLPSFFGAVPAIVFVSKVYRRTNLPWLSSRAAGASVPALNLVSVKEIKGLPQDSGKMERASEEIARCYTRTAASRYLRL